MHLKKLTRQQKIVLSNRGHNPDDFLCVTQTKTSLIVQHRETGKQMLVELTYAKRRWAR